MKTNRRIRTLSVGDHPSAEDDFNAMVYEASRGDTRAIGARAAAYYGRLLAEATDVLGMRHAEAEDVVEDFFLSLCEAKNRFLPRREDAIGWMIRIVRAIAQTRRYPEGDHE